MSRASEAAAERAIVTLKSAIEAAENSNQAGEDFVVAAAQAPRLLGALQWLETYLRDTPHHNAPAAANARAAIAEALGETA